MACVGAALHSQVSDTSISVPTATAARRVEASTALIIFVRITTSKPSRLVFPIISRPTVGAFSDKRQASVSKYANRLGEFVKS